MRVALIVIALAGCDDLFNLEHIDRVDGGSDAAGFDLSKCPSTYNLVLIDSSRYRVLTAPDRAWVQSDLCNADSAGFTHVAVLETSVEAVAAQAELDKLQQFRWWIGAVQDRSAVNPGDGWIWLTGEPLMSGWDAPVEPDDADMIELDHLEQFAVIQQGHVGLIDIAGHDIYTAICECDGRAVDPEAAIKIIASKE